MALKRNLIANYLGQGWTALMGLAFIPLYIKYLGIEAYGLIGLFAVLNVWLRLLDMGMTPTISREMGRFCGGNHSNESIRDLLRSIELIIIAIALFIAGSVAFGSKWIASSWLKVESLPVDVVAQTFAIMGLITALRFIEGVYRSAIIGLQRQVLFNIVKSFMATLRGLGAVGILVWVSPTIKAFFVWQAVISILTLGILSIATYVSLPKGNRPGHFSIKALHGVWRFAGGMMGITLLALMLTKVDKILLSKLLSLSEFGYYALAAAVAGALYILIGPITQAFYPVFCALHARNDADALAESYHKGAQLVSVVAGSAAMVLILFSETFLHLWTRDAELANRVAPLLSLLVAGNLLNGLMRVPYQSQLAHGWTRLGICVNMVSVLVIVPAILWVVPRFGPEGAAWVWISLNTGYILISVQFMHRRILIKEKWLWYIKDLLMPLVAAFVVVALFKILWEKPDNFITQVGVIASASVAALTMSGLFASHTRLQIYRVLKTVFLKAPKLFSG